MNGHVAVRIKGSPWQAVALKSESQLDTVTGYGMDTIRPDTPSAPRGRSDEGLLLDLSMRHFRKLDLSGEESRHLASAILRTVATGRAVRVGPVGRLARHYEFQRRVAAIEIRIGSAIMRLPVQAALRLADALQRLGGPVAEQGMAA